MNQPGWSRATSRTRQTIRGKTPGSVFINPYNFVSLPDRTSDRGLGDPPEYRGAYAEKTFRVVIPIKITAKTPLLITDQPRAEPRDEAADPPYGLPRRVGTRRRADDERVPLLLGSSVRGMLRSAYEAITNSRFGVFDEKSRSVHGAIRLRPQSALDMRMGYVADVADDGTPELRVVRELQPLSRPVEDGRVVGHIDAPSLPIRLGEKLADIEGVGHEALDTMKVTAELVLRCHPRTEHSAPYTFWQVKSIKGPSGRWVTLNEADALNVHGLDQRITVQGLIHWTGSKFQKETKHDERLVPVAVVEGAKEVRYRETVVPPVDVQSLIDSWYAVVASFQQAHENDSTESLRSSHHGSYTWDHRMPTRSWKLVQNRTFHYRVPTSTGERGFLSPAMIGREPFASSAWDLLDLGHRPAETIDQMSPADRVFGWVPQKAAGHGASGWKGLLEVEPPQLDSEPGPAIQEVGEMRADGSRHGVELATLAEPKTSQYRFYSVSRRRGRRSPSGQGEKRSVDQGFDVARGDRLRGRKVYLPHPDTFGRDWEEQAVHGSPVPEHIRPPRTTKARIDTNIVSWVRRGTKFKTTLRAEHLSEDELAALLWLLALPAQAVLGLGGGKPLGFGAVHVEADWGGVVIESVDDIVERYWELGYPGYGSYASAERLGELVDRHKVFLDSADDLKTMRDEFLNSVLGYTGTPVHYPRTAKQDDDRAVGKTVGTQTELFKWWVQNERDPRAGGGLHSLPFLDADPSLPYLDDRQR